jgi:ATP-binding cassette subfamily B protein RaxB
MIAAHYRHYVTLPELRQQNPVSLKGMALDRLMQAARFIHLEPRALRADCKELGLLSLPCLLHWRMNHFVVLERVTAAAVYIADPAVGRRRISRRKCSSLFTGVVLELQPDREFSRKTQSSRLTVFDLLRASDGLLAPIVQILALSIAMQIFALAMPAYLQLAIDQVVLSRDYQLLVLLTVAFAAIVIAHAAISAFRAWCVFYFGTRLNFRWTSGLFHWLLRQPLGFFEKRSVGDIQSRFSSIQPLRDLISSRTVELTVDGLMAGTTGFVIIFYGTDLALAVVLTIALYGAIRLSMFPLISQRSREQLVASAAAESFLLESIRGVLTIKNFGIERQRLTRYRNCIADAFNAAAKVRRLGVIENSVEMSVLSIQGVAVVYLGISDILDAQMTVGMLVAFLAYSSQFSSRSVNLIDGVLQFRLVRIHLDRIADIVDSTPEPVANVSAAGERRTLRLNGAIAANKLWFRYSDDDRWVLKDVSFEVAAGECVAISAPSGYGKTTLLKVMVGLLRAAHGESRFDDLALRSDNVHDLRRQIGIVMQEDRLLAGTVAQNIAAFDESPDNARILEAAKTAGIDADIGAMPMRYLTLVGDMGDVFSGGEKQRILLARALYRNPRILFLDEATSSLDGPSENRIVTALRQLPITRIVIAHRRETIAMCDRVIDLTSINQTGLAAFSTSA